MSTQYQVIFISTPDKKTADALAKGLVEKKLAACVSIVPKITSLYWWNNKIEQADELLLIAKTRAGLIPEITAFVKAHHPYKVPEIVTTAIEAGNPDYLNWLGANTVFASVPALKPQENV